MKEDKIQEALKIHLENLENPPKIFKKGDLVRGKVMVIKKGEILVDVGGRTEGIVQGKELKLEGEVVEKEVGDDVLAYVVKGENEFGQVELSIRKTGVARKWFDLQTAKDNDKPVKVTVIEANTGGVIVSIGEGLRGFIPTSQLDNERIYPLGGYGDKESAKKELQNKLGELIGSEIEVKVIEIDREKNRVIFSEKLVTNEEDSQAREETLESAEVGSNLEGKITGVAPYGLFVNAEGLEGLVHLSEISWDKVSNPADFYKIGDDVKVQIIGMQDNGKRIAYSIKRLMPDPWEEIIHEYKIGQTVKGIVTKVVDYGAFVRIDDKVNGLIHISEMSDKLVKDPHNFVKEGDEIELEIISISREERHLGLSMKRVDDDSKPKKKPTKEVEVEVESKEATSVAREMESLGEILGEEE